MTFRSANFAVERDGLWNYRPTATGSNIGSFEPVVAADCVPPETRNWRTTQRPYVWGQGHISLESACVIALSLSLSERQQFHDDDDDIARHAAATSIRMNTEESITVLIGGADRRERASCTISICIGSPRHWNHNNNPDHSYRALNGIKMSLNALLHRLAFEPAL